MVFKALKVRTCCECNDLLTRVIAMQESTPLYPWYCTVVKFSGKNKSPEVKGFSSLTILLVLKNYRID